MWLLVFLLLTQPTEGVIVRGVVKNDEGKPLENILVQFKMVKEDRIVAETRTDGEGKFSLLIPSVHPSAGVGEEYTFAFCAEGYITSKVTVTFEGSALLLGAGEAGIESQKLDFRKGEIVDLGVITLKKFSYGLTVMMVGLCSVLLILAVLVLVLRISSVVVGTMEKKDS